LVKNKETKRTKKKENIYKTLEGKKTKYYKTISTSFVMDLTSTKK